MATLATPQITSMQLFRAFIGLLMVEWSHRRFIQLLDWGPGHDQQLIHVATGESVIIKERSALSFDDDEGLAFLEAEAAEPDGNDTSKWANSILDRSMHTTVEDGVEKHFMVSRSQGTRTPWQSLLGDVQPSAFVCDGKDSGCLRLERYLRKMPAEGVWHRNFWVVPRVQDFIFGPSVGSKWICKSWHRFGEILRSAEGRNETKLCHRDSTKSVWPLASTLSQ